MSAVVTGVGLAVPGAGHAADLLTSTVDATPVDPAARLGKKGLRYLDQATKLGLCAARDALNASGLMRGDARLTGPNPSSADVELLVPGESVAVVVSSNFGNLDSVCEVVTVIAADGGTRLTSPVLTPRLSSNVIASEIAIRFGLRGVNLMVCNGNTSGLDAVHWAATLLASGRADHVLVVGVEPANDVVRRLTGHEHPLDGAAALVVEKPGRDTAVLAELGDYARTGDLAGCVSTLTFTPQAFFPPESTSDDVLAGVPRHDLADRFGPASGALGVLQCAAAVGHFASGGDGPVYAAAGGDDAVAGLVIRKAP